MRTLLLPAFALLCTAGAHAQLIITEVNSRGTPADYWELTNFGPTSVDLSGYRWDDDSANPADPAAVTVPAGVGIAPGESIIFAIGISAQAFRSAWNLPADVQVITGGPGLGSNDAVLFYNPSFQVVTSLNYAASGFTRTDGQGALGGHAGASAGGSDNQSLILDPNFGSGPGRRYSFATGVNFESYAANAPNDAVGSPGLIGSAGTNAPPVFSSASQTYWKTGVALTSSPFRVTAIDTDPGQAVSLAVVSKPAWLTLSPDGAGTFRLQGTPPSAGDHSFTVRATDSAVPAASTDQTVTLTAFPESAPIILNEFNAVGAGDFLRGGDANQDENLISPGPADSHFGRVQGNGGQWVEFVVVGEGTSGSGPVDMRGWTIEILDSFGSRSLVLSDDPYWQTVTPGTILTFTAADTAGGGLDTDIHRVSALHDSGYLWTNVWIFDPQLVSQSASTVSGDMGISSDDTRFVVETAAGEVVYGPSGEGVASGEGTPGVLLGVNSREVLRLQEDPLPTVDPLFGRYNDADSSSTFGAPNMWGIGPTTQSFESFIAAGSPPKITSAPVTRAYGSYDYQITTSDPNGLAVGLSAPLLPDFLNLSGTLLSLNRPLTLADAGEHVVRIVADNGGDLVTPQVFTLTVFHDQPTVILNEYNAVAETNFLNGGDAANDSDGPPVAVDTHFGRVAGNGGRWFELVVVGDGGPSTVDMRGWTIDIGRARGGSFTATNVLELSHAGYWSAVPAGTILTFIDRDSANGGLDTEINRRDRRDTEGDIWTNIWIGDPELLVFTGAAENGYVIDGGTADGIGIDNDDTRFILKDAAGQPVFGPVGEGTAPVSGISSTEVFELKAQPSPAVSPLAEAGEGSPGYGDGASGSTFGSPNAWDEAGTPAVQDFTAYVATATAYELWAASFELAGSDTEADADPDEDGRSNLEEYAFGGDPSVADAPPVPQQIGRAGSTITWSYLRRSDDPDLEYVHQQSPDLMSWVPAESTVLETVPHPEMDGFETVTVEITGIAEGPLFFRSMVP